MQASLKPISFRWLGVAGFELAVNGCRLLVDPYLSRIPLRKLWMHRLTPDLDAISNHIRPCDWILVTHSHFDHLMDVPAIAESTGASTYGSPNTCQILAAHRLDPRHVHCFGVGDVLSLGPFSVKVLPANHLHAPGFGPGRLARPLSPPLRAHQYRMDFSVSLWIHCLKTTFFVDGSGPLDGGCRSDVLLVYPLHRRERLQEVLDMVRPRLVIPNHWDDMFVPLAQTPRPSRQPGWRWPPLARLELHAFERMVRSVSPNAEVLIPQPFTTYQIGEHLRPQRFSPKSASAPHRRISR